MTPEPQLVDLHLQPLHIKGDLVPEGWWLPPPAPAKPPLHKRFRLEFFTLILPITLAILYLFGIAAPRYVCESEFMVRTPSGGDVGNIATLLTDQKVTRASDETYAASAYLTSRDAVDALVKQDDLRAILASPKADFINRFPNFYTRDTREKLYQHFQNFVQLNINNDSGIAKLSTIAFTPQDALSLNKAMLRDAERFVNRLNTNVFADALSLAAREVANQKAQLNAAEARLTAFRDSQNVLDPNKEVAEAVQRIGILMQRLSQAESDLAQTRALAPNSPQIESTTGQVKALQNQIAAERGKLVGQKNSLSSKFGAFDALVLDRTLAAKQLETALAEYDRARQDAARQHFYLETVVAPEAPDMATQPRRIFYTLGVAALCLCVYSILRSLIQNVREHVGM